jgi:hypothetical protein
MMGGVLAGWRETRGARMVRGVEVGFPLVVGMAEGGWLRVEPAYVIPTRDLGPRRAFAANYRVDLVPPRAARDPRIPVVGLEARGFRENDGVFVVTAQFGYHASLR